MDILNQFYAGFDRGLLNQKPKIEVAVPLKLKLKELQSKKGSKPIYCFKISFLLFVTMIFKLLNILSMDRCHWKVLEWAQIKQELCLPLDAEFRPQKLSTASSKSPECHPMWLLWEGHSPWGGSSPWFQIPPRVREESTEKTQEQLSSSNKLTAHTPSQGAALL